jgi:NADH dehydrogenase
MGSLNNENKLITVFGGSGFVGRHVVRALARRGYLVRVAVRRPEDAHFLQPFGGVGQIVSVQANLRDTASVARAIEGAGGVVNAVGILFEHGLQEFDAIHHLGAKRVAEQTAMAGIKNFVHISALGASNLSPAEYARTKAAGENAVRAAHSTAQILRPSVIFGEEDNFFNLFAAMARISPVLPLIGGGRTKFQPVYVADVAKAVVNRLEADAQESRVYELGGPEIMSFRDILELVLIATDRKRLLVPIPFVLARFEAWFLQMWPWNPLLTVDQVRLLESDNVISGAAKTEGRILEGMGIAPASPQAIVPGYLARFRPMGQFDAPSRLGNGAV